MLREIGSILFYSLACHQEFLSCFVATVAMFKTRSIKVPGRRRQDAPQLLHLLCFARNLSSQWLQNTLYLAKRASWLYLAQMSALVLEELRLCSRTCLSRFQVEIH